MSMKTYKVTPICFAVHQKGESPVHGENTIHVSIDDHGAGAFIKVVEAIPVNPGEEGARVDFAMWTAIVEAVGRLRVVDVEAGIDARATKEAE
jgi:hypothetical protein